MKTLGWLVVTAVMVIGGVVEYGVPAAGNAPSPAVRSAMVHLREEVRPGPGGTLEIANAAYRASFSADDGVTYTPRSGGRLDGRLTWRYRARAIVTGTATRSLDRVTPAVSVTGDHIVDFRRPGLIERYEGERGGVEQVFVLSGRPAGNGDVRIVGDVTFDGTIRPKDGGLEFDAGGLTPFTYAKPIAFDANHLSVPVRVEASRGSLVLVLDGASLDHVHWPVTIDPMFGVAQVDATEDTIGTDVAYNPRRNEFLIVYDTRHPGDPDRTDIRLARVYEDGEPAGTPVTIAAGDGESIDVAPSIACDAVVDRCLVVWMRTPQAPHPELPRVKALLLLGNGTVLGEPFSPGPFAVDTFHATREKYPHVAARNLRPHALDDPCFVVTWSEDVIAQYFYAQFARVSGNGVPLGEGHVPATFATAIDLAYDPVSDRFLTARREPNGYVVFAISPAGVTGPQLIVSSDQGVDPHVAFDLSSRRYLVVWKKGAGGLRGQLLNGQAQPTLVGGNVPLTADPDGASSIPAVDAQNGTFVIAYSRNTGNGLERRLSRIDASGTVVADNVVGNGSSLENTAVSAGGYLLGVGRDNTQALLFAYGAWAPQQLQGAGGDFDGDGKGDLYIYRPSAGRFYVRKSGVPSQLTLQPKTVSFALGGEAHRPVALDWDGDGLADIGVYSIVTGRWTIRLSSTGATEMQTLGHWDDIPVPGDYLGNGADEIAVFRPSTGEWFIRERGSSLTTTVTWGTPGDQPVPGDYDGDGTHELCVFRPRTGEWLRAELDLSGQQVATHGQAGDTAFAGNFVGGPEADRVVFRRGVWYIADGATGTVTQISTGGRIPVTLDWNGDGYQDPAAFNDVTGMWMVLYQGGYANPTFGEFGDIPAGGH